jgi:hypothetical protein
MSDTPRTDAAYFAEGATMYDLAGEAKRMERELNEANADRHRLRDAFLELLVAYEKDNTSYDSYGGEGFDWPICNICAAEGKPGIFSCGLPHEESCIIHKFQQVLSIPPPLVVAKADADAVAVALEMVRDADNDCRMDGFPTIPLAARFRIDNALETYRTKYP